MCFLARDLVVESSFNPLDISHLLQDFIKQFGGTKVEVKVLLEAFCKISQGPTAEGRSMAVFSLSILSHHHLAKVVQYLLQFLFGDFERVWKEVLASADPEKLIHLMAKQIYQSPLVESATKVQHLTSLLHAILRMEDYKAAVRHNFPQLLIALLGMVINFHYDQEFLGGAKEVLHLLLGTTGEQVEAAIVDQLFCRETFSQGLSAMVRAVGKRRWWIPPMVESIIAALGDQDFAGMPQVAAAIYIELLSCRLEVYPCEDTLERLLNWLEHDYLQVRKLSVRGISLLLDSDMASDAQREGGGDPSLLRLLLLDSLSYVEADVLPELIELVDQAYHSRELEEEDLNMLAETYCGLAAHEEASVRASAIEHLGLLRGWVRDQRLPITTTEEEAIHKLLVVLIHLEDEDEVAKAARRALSHLAPEVKWWARSNKFSLHFALHQAAKHMPCPVGISDLPLSLRVFGAFLPAEQLLEAMCFLARDLVVESSFNPLDISHLLQDFIKQFGGTKVEVKVLLEAFCKISQGPTAEGRSMAVFSLSILSHHHLAKVVQYLLQFLFGDFERVWKEVLASADPEKLIHLMAKQIYQSPLVESATKVQHLTSLLHAILRMEDYKAAVRHNFPQLLIALLGMVINFHYDQEFLGGAKEVLHLLLGTTGEQVEAAIVDQLFCRETFSQGLSAMVRAVGKRRWWIPPMVESIIAALGDQDFAGMPQVAAAIYIELLSCRLEVYPCEDTLERLLNWLEHDYLQVRKLSVRGISLLLDSDMASDAQREGGGDPSLLRLLLLDSLSYVEADVLPELIELVDQAYHSRELEEEDLNMLAETYCGLAAHEEASVRASAIEHLGLLRGWVRDQRLPITTTEEEAIHKLLVVLIHLEDEDEVAKAARRALSHLAPEVKWWARSNKFSLHFALHQAAKHMSKTFSKDILRTAALSCTKPSANRLPAVSRVAALLLGKSSNVLPW
ncbi:XP_034990945.1uncharacterized protein LOC118094538 [Podarcis lilfordi]|uniref:XP_034990945.1uncharacterized protein LOC118094538 n=1 Tax=Podarcis lilfordi TaxID=74358 RepID=A0AA35KSX8_9SAUR|nr:XP_034990945.1uncharacterized protein LOC118094538 [Podarcis lilfordi]